MYTTKDKLFYEEFSLSLDVKKSLLNMNYIFGAERTLGRVEGIIVDSKNQIYLGATDPRGFGAAIGY